MARVQSRQNIRCLAESAAGVFNWYLITLSDNPDNLLDMFSANVLKQPYFKKQKGIHAREIYVVGLAKGYAEGLEVITAIIDDVYQQTGAFDIPGYLKFGRNRTR